MRAFLSAAALAVLAGCSGLPSIEQRASPADPEIGSGYTDKPGWTSRNFSVAAANPLAAEAGYQMLKAGGSAVDAAIAVQMVLGLVEPQSSGLGGGAFLLHFDGREVEAYDGRETAPASAGENLFLQADGKPLRFRDAAVGGRAVGTPGAIRMLEMAHRQHGRLPWAQLLAPAIGLAERGFAVSPRLHILLAAEIDLKTDPVALAYFYDTLGQPWPVGHVLKNPEFAEVLRLIAASGADALHGGEVGEAIVRKVRQHPGNPGQLSRTDLANYRALKRQPLCFDYRVRVKSYSICSMPPPSSGTIAIGQILGMLDATGAGSLPLEAGLPSAEWLHLYTEASRLAYADRAQYIADPDFVQPPAGAWSSLLEPPYIAGRAKLIGTMRMKSAPAGQPGQTITRLAPMADQPEYGTSHISVIDRQGHAVALTTSIENVWGSRQMVNRGKGLGGGFLLNNQLTDFSFVPADAAGVPVANRVQGGKRPRSSMAPLLVFNKADGKLLMTIGSPGGGFIIHYTAKTLYGVMNWGLNLQQAISLPNFAMGAGAALLEKNRFPAPTVEAVRAHGHEVREQPMTSGLQGIQRTPEGFFGGADPRREGAVMGD